jgi:hypothetical protein
MKIQQSQLQLYKLILIKTSLLYVNSNSHEIRNVMSPSLHSTTIHFTSLNFALLITFITLFLKLLGVH